MNQPDLSRRRFLTRSAAVFSGLAVGVGLARLGYAEDLAGRKKFLENYKPVFFSDKEWRCLVPCCETLIPADETGPGALEALVPVYIDRQMQTEYGNGGLWYMQGPFYPDSAPEFGYQFKFSPRDLYRLGLAEIEGHCRASHKKAFEEIGAQERLDFLSRMEKGEVEFSNVPAQVFFKQLLANTKEGFLADPIYGGNQNMVGWKMVGFPGARGDYRDVITRHNQAIDLAPISIAGQEG